MRQIGINIIKELQLYKWHEDKDGKLINKPIDKWNHCLDGLRYALEPEITGSGKFIKIDNFLQE